MIVLLGIPSEPPIAMARWALDRAGADYLLVNQREAGRHRLEYRVTGGRVVGQLDVGDRTIDLSTISALYLRPTDHRVLPEREDLADHDPQARHLDELHARWMALAEVLPALVVNRPSAMSSNASKPFQTELIRRHGLATPTTLVTDDASLARAFIDRHDRNVIYKSVSGVRSIVRTIDDEAIARLDRLRGCPTQLQAFVPGDDVRVHVVGSEVIATRIRSTADDYRYARLESTEATLEPLELSDELADRCRSVAAGLGLHFAGIDLRVDGTGHEAQRRAVCFEVNPSPAYSYYEAHTEQGISDALARLLSSTVVPV